MNPFSSIRTVLDFLFRRRRAEREMEEELRNHLQRRADDLERLGISRVEAERQARIEFGGYQRCKEECREALGTRLLSELIADLRYGLRQLRRSPGFTVVAVLTLALGIGANTAIFTLLDAVMLKSLPVANPQQLILLDWTSHAHSDRIMGNIVGDVYRDKSGRWASTSFPYRVYEQIRARNRVFSDVTALAAQGSKLNVTYRGAASRADGQLVSGRFFSTLEIQPAFGRLLTPSDDRTAASPAAVVSYGYWKRRFGGDPRVIGRTITVNSVPFTVVGVSPPEFYGVRPGRAVEIWLPLHSELRVEPLWGPLLETPDSWWALVIGRLKPGVGEQAAKAELEVILQQCIAPQVKRSANAEAIPHLGVQSAGKGLNDLRSEFSKPLLLLMVVVGLVLLIACANVANLLLARAAARQKEIAVRMALGGGQGRVVRQLLTEGVLLATLGGAAGLLLAFWSINLLVTFMAGSRHALSLNVAPDLRVLGFTAAASVLTGIIFGLSPAVRLSRMDLTPILKECTGKLFAGAGPRRGWLSDRLLVVAQVSISIILLIGAVAFVRTLVNLEKINLGFDQHNLLLFGIDPTQDGYKGHRVTDFYQELARRIEGLPGVRSVGLSENTLIGGGASFLGTKIKGYSSKGGEQNGGKGAFYNWVGAKFFETMGIPLTLGRTLTDSDTESAPKVAVVNEQFVRQFFGGENPIGQRFSVGSRKGIEIVGVVGDAQFYDIRKEMPPTAYLPYLQYVGDLNPMHFEVRTAGKPMTIVGAVRRMVQIMDSHLALYDVRSQTQQINQTLFQQRLLARLTGFFAVLAALLAAVGIYGIMAFAVTRRTHEIGIRMALGARRHEIAVSILREAFVLVGIGAAIGIVVALIASRLLSTMLYGLSPDDPMTIALATLLMLGAGALAAFVPARRAARVDPMVALRHE